MAIIDDVHVMNAAAPPSSIGVMGVFFSIYQFFLLSLSIVDYLLCAYDQFWQLLLYLTFCTRINFADKSILWVYNKYVTDVVWQLCYRRSI